MELLKSIAAAPAGRRTKWLVILAWIAIVMVASPLAGKIGDVEDNETAHLARSAETSAYHELEKRFNTDEPIPAVVVYSRDGGLSADDRAKADRDRHELVRFTPNRQEPEAVPAQDGMALMLTVPVPPSEDGFTDKVKQLRAVVHAGLSSGLDVHVAGPAGQITDEVEVFGDLDAKLLIATVGVVALLLLLTYRSPVLWILPLLCVGLASQIANAVIYLLGEHADMPVDSQATGILTVLVFGVGTDYALLLIARYREELHNHADRHHAMAVALRRSRGAILAAAATVTAGLLCLLVAEINSSRGLGGVGAVGVLSGLVAVITLLPALLVVMGRWVFWPFIPRSGLPVHESRAWAGVSSWVGARPRAVWAGTALVLIGLTVAAFTVETGPTQEQKFRTTPESVAGQQVVAEHFPAGASAPAKIIAAAGAAGEVTRAVRATSGIDSIQLTDRSGDGKLIRISAVFSDAPDTNAAKAAVQRLRVAVHAVDGADAVVGGPTAEALDGANGASRDRWVAIPLVLGVVMLILILLLRAIIAPTFLIVTVVLSYLAALGGAWLLLNGPMGIEALDNSVPLLGFIFLVALGVDYNIFLMHRVRQEVATTGHRPGVLKGLRTTGGVITSAGLVLAATFSVLAGLPLAFMAALGTVVAFGVLLDTFIVRSLLVPALSLDAGSRIWWPSHPTRRVAGPPDDAAPAMHVEHVAAKDR